jgi:hypothetical protein
VLCVFTPQLKLKRLQEPKQGNKYVSTQMACQNLCNSKKEKYSLDGNYHRKHMAQARLTTHSLRRHETHHSFLVVFFYFLKPLTTIPFCISRMPNSISFLGFHRKGLAKYGKWI